jgi:hypothetical protein
MRKKYPFCNTPMKNWNDVLKNKFPTTLSFFWVLRRYSELVAKWRVPRIRRGYASKLEDACSSNHLRAFEGSVRIRSNTSFEYPHKVTRRRVYERPISPAAHSSGLIYTGNPQIKFCSIFKKYTKTPMVRSIQLYIWQIRSCTNNKLN